jgi:hypothetical protein
MFVIKGAVMSRTQRKPYTKNTCLRNPQSLNYLKGNQAFVDSLLEEGFFPRNRETAKANPQNIPNAWDDKAVAALYEIDYCNGKIWK